MPLILTLASTRGPGHHETRVLSAGTLSIGRAPGNDWVLPDPDRHLSKTHCVIGRENGRYVLTDLSTNGVYINGATTPTTRDSRVVLTDGDQFRIGEYSISVAEAEGPAAAQGAADPFATLPGGGGPLDGDPLDDPLGGSRARDFQHPLPQQAPPRLRDADPFDVADEEGRHGSDSGDDLFRGATPAESWQGPTQPDNVDVPAHAFSAPKPLAPPPFNPAEIDFDALIGDLPPGQSGPSAPATAAPSAAPTRSPFDDLDDLLGGDAVPGVDPQPAAAAQAPPAPPSPAPPLAAAEAAPPPRASPPPAPADVSRPEAEDATPGAAGDVAEDTVAARMLAAFLAGAGVPDLRPTAAAQDPEAALRAAGEVFRAVVEGLREALISRAAVKSEFRVEQTMLRTRDNNPLKFSVTAEDATAALLQPGRPGYKAPLEAAREAFDDLRSHEMAVMAGVQTALMGLLHRFDPAALEQRLQPGVLGNLLPASRKARTWELFCATYKDIAREAEDDFQSIFGREFARAYAAQVRKL